MRDELDEAKVTAYALGALEGEEASRIERLIESSEEARRQVEEVRETAAELRTAYGAPRPHALSVAQRRAIEAAAGASTPRRSRGPLLVVAALATAAMVVIGVGVPSLLRARVGLPRDRHTAAPLPPPATITVPAPNAQAPAMSYEQAERLKELGYISEAEVPGGVPDGVATSRPESNTEDYGHLVENPFVLVSQDPRSTFSVDVDTASYAIVRRFLNAGQMPPVDAVRIEELINYFTYDYAPPQDGRPFAVYMETAAAPWAPDHRLVRIAVKGRDIARAQRPPANLVFLLDVSGSMDAPDKLPLVKAAMRLLVDELGPRDRVAIVVYAGAEGLALPSTAVTDKAEILSAIESLSPGGATHGSSGIRLAYETASAHFMEGAVNRVILATDGDFNVGVTSQGELVRLIEEKAKSGVFLSVLGFGTGNLKDATLEKLADHGNGNYAYIDELAEARKVLVEQAGSTLVTIAKDVKLQVEFNPSRVKAYRLLGYENRVLAHQDFNDDRRDAGDIGAGHTVTAFYEVVPVGTPLTVPGVDPLKYQEPARPTPGPASGEWLTLKLRYKEPDGVRSALIEAPLADVRPRAFREASTDFRFATAVAGFGMTLRRSPHKGDTDLAKVMDWAEDSRGQDESGLRAGFLELVAKARKLSPR